MLNIGFLDNAGFGRKYYKNVFIDLQCQHFESSKNKS